MAVRLRANRSAAFTPQKWPEAKVHLPRRELPVLDVRVKANRPAWRRGPGRFWVMEGLLEQRAGGTDLARFDMGIEEGGVTDASVHGENRQLGTPCVRGVGDRHLV